MTLSRTFPRLVGLSLSFWAFSLILTSITGCDDRAASSRPPLEVSWGVDDNLVGGSSYFLATLSLHNFGLEALEDHGWALYFNSIRPIIADSIRGRVAIRRVNGDFYELTPKEGFHLPPVETYSVRVVARNWAIRETGAPSGFYFVEDGFPPITLPPVRIRPFVSDRQTKRHEADVLPVATPERTFDDNLHLTLVDSDSVGLIVPTPKLVKRGEGSFTIDGPATVDFDPRLQLEAENLASNLRDLFGLEVDLSGADDETAVVTLSIDDAGFDSTSCPSGEAYRLAVNEFGIRIAGSDAAGVFYGIQSLIALVDPHTIGSTVGSVFVPIVNIDDCPRFGHRGLMIDPARHFIPLDRIKKTIKFMSFYKLNRLQLHLTEDEGWRLPVAALPELIQVGSRRGHTLDSKEHLPPSHGSGPDPYSSPGSGSYSRAEFVELLTFADRHHIEVIPEIDTPGHMRSAVKSMEHRYARLMGEGQEEEALKYLLTEPDDRSTYRSIQGWDDNVANVCLESTYTFMETIFDELIGLFEEAGVELRVINLGGDEVPDGVWVASPACKRLLAENDHLSDVHDLSAHYFERLVGLLEEKGLKGAGWEEIGLRRNERGEEVPKETLTGRVIPYAWNSVWGWGGESRAYKLANAGYDVVMGNVPNLYFDLAYTKHPSEPGFAWGGFVKTRTVFEMTPLDIYNSAYVDRLGAPIDPATYANHERLRPETIDRIIGIQGQLWGENTMSEERYDYLLYPKMLGLSERAWAARPGWSMIANPDERRTELDKDWNRFANVIGQREFARLSRMHGGLGYRVPPPGAMISEGLLAANVDYPGLVVRYTTDRSDPSFGSPRAEGPISVSGDIFLRSFTSDGLDSSRTVQVSFKQ